MILEKNICLESVMLKVSPRNKKHSLQFLPSQLLTLSNSKNFQYKGQKLKSAYIIDIVHNLLLKYYFKKENSKGIIYLTSDIEILYTSKNWFNILHTTDSTYIGIPDVQGNLTLPNIETNTISNFFE